MERYDLFRTRLEDVFDRANSLTQSRKGANFQKECLLFAVLATLRENLLR
jgi:hypothetical protein